jgi:putative membrane protein
MTRLMMMALLLVAGSAYAADSATADRDFYAKAAAGGMAEVETGKLAQAKGHSAAVRDFGEMMVRDHSRANDKLKQIAGRKKIELPTEPDAKHKAKKQELEAASGATFDSAYIQAQVADHEATESLLKQQIESGTDAEAKAWARESLPTVTAHLQRARALASGATASDAGQHR